MILLQRIQKGNVQGVQYNGNNVTEVCKALFGDVSLTVGYNVHDKIIRHKDTTIRVGDWIVHDETKVHHIPQSVFQKMYEVREVPVGYKRVDATTGKPIE